MISHYIIYIIFYHSIQKLNFLNWIDFLIWYQSFNNQVITSLNLTISIYLIKIK
jgi:hypothetical protein